MAAIEMYELTREGLTEIANAVKENLLAAMEREKLLTKPASEICEDYAVLITKPGLLGKMFRWIKGEDPPKNGIMVSIMRKI